jgi:hypothetical protein
MSLDDSTMLCLYHVVQKIYPTLKAAGVDFTAEVVAYETDTSSVGEIICERAIDTDAAAVIMASHGKGRIHEFFVGSVTNYCLHRCKKPVVIFRSPPTIDTEGTKKKKSEKVDGVKVAAKNGGIATPEACPHVHAE